jgi:FkbM family methyltransferase
VKPRGLKKLVGGIERFGVLRSVTGVVRYLKFKIGKPQRGMVSTITDNLRISFAYPKQFMGTLVVFRELVEPEYQFLRKALNKDSVFIDIGGGIGNYSMCAGRVVNGPIHTFEPIEDNLRTIRENLRANKLESKVQLNCVALSGSEGFGRMAKPEADDFFGSKLASVSMQPTDGSVAVTTLDAYCARNKIDYVDMIKIDVEGHEHEVMEGTRRLIDERRIGVMILEADHRLGEFYSSLQTRGFHFFYYNTRNNSLIRIFPLTEENLLNEPTAFSSNVILIHEDKLDTYRRQFDVIL